MHEFNIQVYNIFRNCTVRLSHKKKNVILKMEECIICLCADENVIRLPCLCKGPCGAVHVECQKGWNPPWRCSVCRYVMMDGWFKEPPVKGGKARAISRRARRLLKQGWTNGEDDPDVIAMARFLLDKRVDKMKRKAVQARERERREYAQREQRHLHADQQRQIYMDQELDDSTWGSVIVLACIFMIPYVVFKLCT